MQRVCQIIIALATSFICAAQTSPLTLPVGGLKAGAVVRFSGETTLREPDGPRGRNVLFVTCQLPAGMGVKLSVEAEKL